MDLLKNINLIKSDESKVSSTDVLAGKTFICLYFSANWCPDMTPMENKIGSSNLVPNRGFTPILKEFYDKVKTEGVEIIFVSSDDSHQDMISYMKESHGDWYAVEHGSIVAKGLKERFSVSGIPVLVVLKSDGKMVTKNGRETIKSLGSNAVKEWITSTLVFETVSSTTTKINSECKSNGEGNTNTKFNCFKNMQLDELEPGESGNSQFYCEIDNPKDEENNVDY